MYVHLHHHDHIVLKTFNAGPLPRFAKQTGNTVLIASSSRLRNISPPLISRDGLFTFDPVVKDNFDLVSIATLYNTYNTKINNGVDKEG